MEDRLCWIEKGEVVTLLDRESGYEMGHVEASDQGYTFFHLGRPIIYNKDRKAIQQIAQTIVGGLLKSSAPLTMKVQ